MFRDKDPYSYTQVLPLYLQPPGEESQTQIGFVLLDYRVILYNDVQVFNTACVTQPQNQQFLVNCTQRILITNPFYISQNPIKSTPAYEDYPAIVTSSIDIAGVTADINSTTTIAAQLIDYDPQTVNTAVQQGQSGTTSDGSVNSIQNTNTTGSSFTQSSTYGTSVSTSVGFMGEIPTGSVTATASHESTNSRTTDRSRSRTTDSSSSKSSDSSSSAGMSIKDWGSYATVNSVKICPNWVFGQEYPWSAIKCRYSDGTQNENNKNQEEVSISVSMQTNLYDGKFLYPPSELSTYGPQLRHEGDLARLRSLRGVDSGSDK